MASIQSVFFKPSRGIRKWEWNTTTGSRINSSDVLYQLDGVVSEQHTSEIRLTKNPVEYGADIVDHAFRLPMKLVVKGVITNSPFIKQYLNRIPGSSESGISGQVGGTFTGQRIMEAYQGLLDIQFEMRPLTIQTGLMDYDNMILTKVSTPNDITNRLDLTLTFEEAMFADSGDDSDSTKTYALTNSPSATDIATGVGMITGLGITLVSS